MNVRSPVHAVALSVPGRNAQLVPRPRLLERLFATPTEAVVLICAPAGSGKTMLLHSWASGLLERLAWVTVDRNERDAQRFWHHLVGALADAAGDDQLERFSPGPSFSGTGVVERLVAQLGDLAEPIVLVVDDLHELISSDARALLEFFLEQRPPQLKVVLSSREDPTLGLHRLRLAAELTEIRGPDLRFSIPEARQLLCAGGIGLSEAGLTALYERTEGWAAGLRLAAISLADHPDPERFVAEFSGSERTVAGYLVAEVLERQPPDVRDLLLRTSILERVSGPLADVLTGGTGGEAILQQLEDQNAFVTALDAGRSWFRYHHLFADLLRLELRRTAPATVPSLHRAAAAWWAAHGEIVAAVRHHQAAGDWADAARLLMGDNYLALRLAGRTQTMHALLEVFPRGAVETDPNLAVLLAIDNTVRGVLDQGAGYLAVAEQGAAAIPDNPQPQFEVFLAGAMLALARRRGDVDLARKGMARMEEARMRAAAAGDPPPSLDNEALALMNLGIAELWSLNAYQAAEHLEQALTLAQQTERPYVEIECLAHLAMTAPLTDHPLSLSISLWERAAAVAEANGWTGEPVSAAAFAIAGMIMVRLAWFDETQVRLELAERALRGVREPSTELVLHFARGLLAFGQGRLDEALTEFTHAQQMETLLVESHLFATELRSRIVQVQVQAGDVEAARCTLEGFGTTKRDQAGFHISTAVLALACDEPERALEALAPVMAGTVASLHARWTQAEALLLIAIARDRMGDRRASEDALEGALARVEPETMILPFAFFPVRELLERHPRHRTAHATLLATILGVLDGAAPTSDAGASRLDDPLSEAELRVLRYLPSNLSASEIANELFVSANTVRTHLRHIYLKLDAHTRSEAVARARELGLVGPALVKH
jgi:LuxR family transcriptional regulator, maltose regulon positive regulatory protein